MYRVFYAEIGIVCFNATDYTGVEHAVTRFDTFPQKAALSRGKQNALKIRCLVIDLIIYRCKNVIIDSI